MNCALLLLATLSIWDYPARYPMHESLRRQFVAAVRKGDTVTMEKTCRKGVELLPDDPTWHFNLACAFAYFQNREESAFDELEKAIDLGFRDREAIAADTDLKRLSGHARYAELLDYAAYMRGRPMITGPMATVNATGLFGRPVFLGEANLGWDFDVGCFVAKLRLTHGAAGGNAGDLYVNRDAGHSLLTVTNHPGLTVVKLDEAGRSHRMDMSYPNTLYPYPVFGNASLGLTRGPFARSLPRAMVTVELATLQRMVKFYLSNQIWVFPSVGDTAPVGTNGDLFASITPYWITSAGRSWSDLPYLDAALLASRSLPSAVKSSLVSRGLLAPTIQTLMRKSLKGVTTEEDYLTARAHPSAFPPGGIDRGRLAALSGRMTESSIPPLVPITVRMRPPKETPPRPELTYASAFASAFVLRTGDASREFDIEAHGADEYAFVQTHGGKPGVKIERTKPNAVRVTLETKGLSPTNRVDVTVVGRGKGSGWGAPSYVSFARMDPSHPLSDPLLTALPAAKRGAPETR